MGDLSVAVVPVSAFQQNCTLIWDTATLHAVIVDPGGNIDRIRAALTRRNLVPHAIWLTHGHLDHVGGAEPLRAALGDPAALPIIGPHRADAFLLDTVQQQAATYGIPGDACNVTPDQWLDEGDTLALDDHRFDVLHIPGHSPGHVVFINPAARFAQLGDVLFAGSVGRTDFPYGDHAALIDGIRRKLLPLGDDLRFICGHGPGSNIGQERLNNPFLT